MAGGIEWIVKEPFGRLPIGGVVPGEYPLHRVEARG
jgi:hypothetical protein